MNGGFGRICLILAECATWILIALAMLKVALDAPLVTGQDTGVDFKYNSAFWAWFWNPRPVGFLRDVAVMCAFFWLNRALARKRHKRQSVDVAHDSARD